MHRKLNGAPSWPRCDQVRSDRCQAAGMDTDQLLRAWPHLRTALPICQLHLLQAQPHQTSCLLDACSVLGLLPVQAGGRLLRSEAGGRPTHHHRSLLRQIVPDSGALLQLRQPQHFRQQPGHRGRLTNQALSHRGAGPGEGSCNGKMELVEDGSRFGGELWGIEEACLQFVSHKCRV